MTRLPAIAFAVLIMAAGCSSSPGNPGSGPGSGGAGGTQCTMSSTDCYCSSTTRGTLSECSSTSIASTDHGFCCSGATSDCHRIACVSLDSIGYCDCGTPVDDNSPRVDTCLPNGGTCCLDTLAVPYDCHCSAAVPSCPDGQMQVASCSLADVMVCSGTDTVVDRCK